MATAPREKALQAVRAAGLIRPRDLATAGVPTWVLYELVKDGAVKQVGRGLYCIPDYSTTEPEYSGFPGRL